MKRSDDDPKLKKSGTLQEITVRCRVAVSDTQTGEIFGTHKDSFEKKKKKKKQKREKELSLAEQSASVERRNTSDVVMNNVIRLGCHLSRWNVFVYECTTRHC